MNILEELVTSFKKILKKKRKRRSKKKAKKKTGIRKTKRKVRKISKPTVKTKSSSKRTSRRLNRLPENRFVCSSRLKTNRATTIGDVWSSHSTSGKAWPTTPKTPASCSCHLLSPIKQSICSSPSMCRRGKSELAK